jgi:hypothetical protein
MHLPYTRLNGMLRWKLERSHSAADDQSRVAGTVAPSRLTGVPNRAQRPRDCQTNSAGVHRDFYFLLKTISKSIIINYFHI